MDKRLLRYSGGFSFASKWNWLCVSVLETVPFLAHLISTFSLIYHHHHLAVPWSFLLSLPLSFSWSQCGEKKSVTRFWVRYFHIYKFITTSFYRKANWNSELLMIWPKITQLVKYESRLIYLQCPFSFHKNKCLYCSPCIPTAFIHKTFLMLSRITLHPPSTITELTLSRPSA